MRLLEVDCGGFRGQVLNLNGIGNGLRLFKEGGHFRIEVIATLAEWETEVSGLDDAQAARTRSPTWQTPALTIPTDATID